MLFRAVAGWLVLRNIGDMHMHDMGSDRGGRGYDLKEEEEKKSFRYVRQG